MTDWVKWAALGVWGLLMALFRTFLDERAGSLKEQLKEAQTSETSIIVGNQATNDVDSMSRANKLRFLERRSRVRGSPSNNNGQ